MLTQKPAMQDRAILVLPWAIVSVQIDVLLYKIVVGQKVIKQTDCNVLPFPMLTPGNWLANNLE